MSKKYISQKELADFFEVKQPYISKLAKKGIFAYCYDGKKLLRDKAIYAYMNNQKTVKNSPGEKLSEDISDIEINVHTSEVVMKKEVYSNENMKELKDLIESAKLTPGQRVTIIKEFWNGKLSEQKYLENQKQLISVDQVVKDVQKILLASRSKFLAMPTRIAPLIVGLKNPSEIESIVQDHIYEALEELSKLKEV